MASIGHNELKIMQITIKLRQFKQQQAGYMYDNIQLVVVFVWFVQKFNMIHIMMKVYGWVNHGYLDNVQALIPRNGLYNKQSFFYHPSTHR